MLKSLLGTAIAIGLTACGADAPTSTATPTAAPLPEPTPSADPVEPDVPAPDPSQAAAPTPVAAALTSGTYCYTINDGILTGAVRLTVAGTQVSGDSSIAIQDEAAGYYSSYVQDFFGNLAGDRATLTVDTWIEYDQQTTQETWVVTPETLGVDRDTFFAADCASAAVVNWLPGPDELTGEDLLAALPPGGQRVAFAPGTSGTTLENSVVRGDRDLYILGAQGGQEMTLFITSLEDNAVFDVVSPSGDILLLEGVGETLMLPQTGDYSIIVGGTRGNATYSLDVLIE